MDSKQSLFNENELKKVVFCAVLMSSTDQDLHDKERTVIDEFSMLYWKDQYGSVVDFLEQVVKEVDEIVRDKDNLTEKTDALISELQAMLNEEQHPLVLDLLSKIMLADNRLDRNEAILLGTFKKKFNRK